MYSYILTTHSLFRWLVLLSLLYAIYRGYKGWLGNNPFTGFDNYVRHITATIAHIQFMLGLWLYFISPVVAYFLQNFGSAIHERQFRFFGMEHSTMMFVAIAIISVGSSKAKREVHGPKKFKTMAIWFTIGLLVILSSIPWSFSPLVSRPLFRVF